MSRTEENLWKAFAGESQARNRYTFFAQMAREEGYEQIAAIFEETAENERAHAKRIFDFLKALDSTASNLKAAAEGEHYEFSEMYPEFERVAREEGLTEIADFFKEVAEVEEQHERRYLALLKNLNGARAFKRNESVRWKCRNCGYVYEGKEAPNECPACTYPQAFFEILCENW
jgi:rubrerythrin